VLLILERLCVNEKITAGSAGCILDGIFAVALTVLVLELTPRINRISALAFVPTGISYAVSFSIIALFG